MDISKIPVIDNHIHIFPPYRKHGICMAITSFPMDKKHTDSMISYKIMVSRLRKFFGMPENASDEEVMAERDRRYDADPEGYCMAFMKDANIKSLVCDLDSPILAYWRGNYRTEKDVDEFTDMMEPEVPIAKVIRIEVNANLLLDKMLSFEDFLDAWRERMLYGINKYKCVALKSVIAYFTGLAVKNPTKEEAKKAYEAFLNDRNDRENEKIWRDFMLHKGLELCHEFNLPLHIHTGFGDAPYADLRTVNPILLLDFLTEELSLKVPTVLLHGGYPYGREIGIMASQLPQLYLDFSELLPMSGYAAENIFNNIMESAPVTKVLFGTDGGGVPETVWLGAVYAKEIVGEFFTKLIEKGIYREEEAYEACEKIFYKNALELYPEIKI